MAVVLAVLSVWLVLAVLVAGGWSAFARWRAGTRPSRSERARLRRRAIWAQATLVAACLTVVALISQPAHWEGVLLVGTLATVGAGARGHAVVVSDRRREDGCGRRLT